MKITNADILITLDTLKQITKNIKKQIIKKRCVSILSQDYYLCKAVYLRIKNHYLKERLTCKGK